MIGITKSLAEKVLSELNNPRCDGVLMSEDYQMLSGWQPVSTYETVRWDVIRDGMVTWVGIRLRGEQHPFVFTGFTGGPRKVRKNDTVTVSDILRFGA